MKRAELRLLEVWGYYLRMPGEGDVSASSYFAGDGKVTSRFTALLAIRGNGAESWKRSGKFC
jgi:hypothetical protein